jgi:hypothetical protein
MKEVSQEDMRKKEFQETKMVCTKIPMPEPVVWGSKGEIKLDRNQKSS